MSLVFVRSNGSVVHMDYLVAIREVWETGETEYTTMLGSAHASFRMRPEEMARYEILDPRAAKQAMTEAAIDRGLRTQDPEVHAEAVRLGWLTVTRID